MIFSDPSPKIEISCISLSFTRKYANRRFIFGSTSRRSLNPIPHGLPGVASNMNPPNSGWKTGSVSSSLQYVSTLESSSLCKHPYLEIVCNSGTHPPCLLSASSFASASRMSACRKDNFTFRRSSSKATTRYSIYHCHELRSCQKTMVFLPHLPTTKHPSPCLLLAARLREVAVSNEFRAVIDKCITRWHTSIPHWRT